MADAMQWVAYYADGTRRTSAEGTWADLPVQGCVVALFWDAAGVRHLECGYDALLRVDDAIVGVNLPTPAFTKAAATEAKRGHLKYGVYMAPDAWAAIREVAQAQYEFPA